MNDNQGSSTPSDDRHEARHEPVTLSIRGVVIATCGLVLLVLVVAAGMAALQASFARPTTRAVKDAQVPGVAELPPEQPRLDPYQPRELAALRAEEEAILESYGWIDREGGIARIPIDRAIRLLAQEGLPEPTPPTEQASETSENIEPVVRDETRDQP